MKTTLMIGAALLFVPGFASAQSLLPKEGTVKITTYYTGSVKALPAGDDVVAVTYDVLGIVTSSAGQGPFHLVSTQCVGGFTATKGGFGNEQGACTYIDRDGDKFFSRHTGTGRRGERAVVKSELIGGTGKYAGIAGTIENARSALRPTSQSAAHTVAEGTVTYRLP
jgi:hypothetical protein